MKISQASTATGISERMIRHHEKIGLVPPPHRRQSGYRDYDQTDLHGLRFIGRARDLNFTIEEIGKLLALWHDRDRSSADVKALALACAAELKKKPTSWRRCAGRSSSLLPAVTAAGGSNARSLAILPRRFRVAMSDWSRKRR